MSEVDHERIEADWESARQECIVKLSHLKEAADAMEHSTTGDARLRWRKRRVQLRSALSYARNAS